jgi:hypothetical protein
VIIFGQAFLNHRFLTLYLLPFFAVSTGLGLARLWRIWSSPELKRRWCSVGVVGVALLSSLPGNARLATLNWRSEPVAEVRSSYRRLQRLAEQIRPQVREGDRLLILSGERYSEPEKVTVFHELWIPCVDGGGIGKVGWTHCHRKIPPDACDGRHRPSVAAVEAGHPAPGRRGAHRLLRSQGRLTRKDPAMARREPNRTRDGLLGLFRDRAGMPALDEKAPERRDGSLGVAGI